MALSGNPTDWQYRPGSASQRPMGTGTYRPDAGQAANPLLGGSQGRPVDGAARAVLVNQPHDNGSQDGRAAIVDFASAGLTQQVLSDQASQVRRKRDDRGPVLTRVRNQEHTAIEIHASNDLNLKARLDVRKIELHVTPVPADTLQPAECSAASQQAAAPT